MGSPSAAPPLLYRSTRLLRTAFQHLHRQQQRGDVFCDVVLRAEGEAVVAHCSVLSVCSPFFMEQLGRELPLRGRRVVLELAGLKIGVLRKLVRFFYTAELEVAQEEVQEVLAAARRLRVTELESLQLQGGHLVRLRPQRQLDRSCLSSPAPAPRRAEPGRAGSTGVPRHAQGPARPGPIGPVKLRKVESRGCWEVVRDTQPRTAPPALPAGSGGGMEARTPLDVSWTPCAARRQQGCGQAVAPGIPGADPEEEEVDVGMEEPFLPAGTICLLPCPSSESEEEVDVLT